MRELPPILLILIRKHFGKLRDTIISHINEARRIINDKTYRDTVVWIQYLSGRGFRVCGGKRP
jgi:hypothetical protein